MTPAEVAAYRRHAVDGHLTCHAWTLAQARNLRARGYRAHAARALAVAATIHRPAAVRALAFWRDAPYPDAPLTLF